MAYISLCKALYDYAATAEDELSFAEDALLYVVDNADAEWWKAKLKTSASGDADEDDDGPVGLIPANYVEEAEPVRVSRALYDYAKQNDDELDMAEDELISVYEVKGEWLLVKRQEGGVATGNLGLVPANYVDEVAAVDGIAEPMEAHDDYDEPEPAPIAAAPVSSAPKAAKDDAIQMWAVAELDAKKKKKKGTLGIGNSSLFFASESDKAPVRKISVMSIIGHTVENKGRQINLQLDEEAAAAVSADDLHIIRFVLDKKGEADEVWSKIEESKAKTARANAEEPAPAQAAPQEEYEDAPEAPAPPAAPAPPPLPTTARSPPPAAAILPPPSRAFLPPPTRTAAAKAPEPEPEPEEEAETEAHHAATGGTGEEEATALYDFEAQGDDELTVAENEKLILVDRETDDWWKVRNASGQEGVVPASYVEVSAGGSSGATGHTANGSASAGHDEEAAAASALAIQQQAEEEERRRQEEEEELAERERLQAERRAKAESQARAREAEDRRRQALKAQPAPAPPRAPAPPTTTAATASRDVSIPRDRSAPARPKEATSKSKPNPSQTRVWHDRTAQFKVEAEFLGFNHGKIRLHKLNGVVIEVAVEKMSNADIAYLEEITGRRLMPAGRSSRSAASSSDPRRPDRDVERRREHEREQRRRRDQGRGPRRNVDWFEFFLAAGVDIDECTRYASAFERDKIDEALLPEMDAGVLRSIGLREGDIIRVVKFIQKRYHGGSGRGQSNSGDMARQIKSDEALARKLQEQEQSARKNGTTPPPNLFSGPDGSLKNNTRRGRPTPLNRSTSGVDAASLAAASESLAAQSPTRSSTASPELAKAAPASTSANGFDDDAWTPRPSSAKPTTPAPAAVPETPPPQPPRPPAAAAPPAAPTPPPVPPPPAQPAATPAEPPKPPADPNSALFDKLAAMKPPSGGSSPSITRPGASPMGNNGLFNGPRGPFAPVASNQHMLQPLIPTQGTGQFMPTGLGHQPTGMGFMQPQQTGYNMYPQQTGFGMQPQQTGFGMQPQATGYGNNGFGGAQSPFGMQAQPTGFMSSQMTGMPGQQPIAPQQTAQQYNNQQQQRQNDEANSGPERFSAANVFGQMKQGNMHAKETDSAPQAAQRYDALRPQPTGFQPGGYLGQQYTGFNGGYGQY